MRRLAPSFLVFALALSAHALAQPACDNFPWVITGSDVPGGVVVNSCGLWVGCLPHDPHVAVSGNQIAITFTAAALPDCICIPVQIPFNQNVLVPSLPAGTYTATVTVMNCGQPQVVGTGTVVSGGVPAIPTLDRRGTAMLVLLLGAVAVWILRS